MIEQSRVLFVSTSMCTKWEFYSRALVQKYFPSATHLIIDGRRSWHPLYFLTEVIKIDADYVVHIDEDCFLLDAAPLESIIDFLDKHHDYAVAGTPDGGVPYRFHNYYACNLFFTIFRQQALKEALGSQKRWMKLRYNPSHIPEGALTNYPFYNDKYTIDEFENYYPIFWLIFKCGYKTKYLKVDLNKDYLASDVYVEGFTCPFARHMWYLRDWNNQSPHEESQISHYERYMKLESNCLKPLIADKLYPDNAIRKTIPRFTKIQYFFKYFC